MRWDLECVRWRRYQVADLASVARGASDVEISGYLETWSIFAKLYFCSASSTQTCCNDAVADIRTVTFVAYSRPTQGNYY